MTSELRPGTVLFIEMLGNALIWSSRLMVPMRSMSIEDNTSMLCGTSWRLISRLVAVTMTSSSLVTPSSSCASAAPGRAQGCDNGRRERLHRVDSVPGFSSRMRK